MNEEKYKMETQHISNVQTERTAKIKRKKENTIMFQEDGQQCIGSGGYGSVFLSSDRKNAVKRFYTDRGDGIRKLDWWEPSVLRDALFTEAVGRGTPNVVTAHEVVFQPESGECSIKMELARGDLFGLMQARGGQLTTDTCLRVVFDVATALSALHAENIVHRDVKAENILFLPPEAGGSFLLSDFGLSRVGRAFAHSVGGTVPAGSFNIRAPEILFGSEELGEEVDIFALGCTILDMWLPASNSFTNGRRSEIGQLMGLLRFFGAPHYEEDWPAVVSMPNFSNQFPRCPPSREWLELTAAETAAGSFEDRLLVDLICAMCVWNPRKRASATALLQMMTVGRPLSDVVVGGGAAAPPATTRFVGGVPDKSHQDARRNVVDWWWEVSYFSVGSEPSTVVASLLFFDIVAGNMGFPKHGQLQVVGTAVYAIISAVNDSNPVDLGDLVEWTGGYVPFDRAMCFIRKIVGNSRLRSWIIPSISLAHVRCGTPQPAQGLKRAQERAVAVLQLSLGISSFSDIQLRDQMPFVTESYRQQRPTTSKISSRPNGGKKNKSNPCKKRTRRRGTPVPVQS